MITMAFYLISGDSATGSMAAKSGCVTLLRGYREFGHGQWIFRRHAHRNDKMITEMITGITNGGKSHGYNKSLYDREK